MISTGRGAGFSRFFCRVKIEAFEASKRRPDGPPSISAGMMKLADMRDLGSRAAMRWGSSPHARTSSEIPAAVPFPASPKTALWRGFLRIPPRTASLGSRRRGDGGCRLRPVSLLPLPEIPPPFRFRLRRKLRSGGDFFAFRRGPLRWIPGGGKTGDARNIPHRKEPREAPSWDPPAVFPSLPVFRSFSGRTGHSFLTRRQASSPRPCSG